MDKPPIDLERLKEIKGAQKKEEVIEPEKLKAPERLTDPYYYRRHLINIPDFDEWG